MSTLRVLTSAGVPVEVYGQREAQLQRVLIAYIVIALIFMLLPGTFLGVWNLISISSQHDLQTLSPAWMQAHGHAQIFGWIGTFILGIGFYSLSKMGGMPAYAVPRAWVTLAFWTLGVCARWHAGVTQWHWRILLPGSAVFELVAFLIFFQTVSGHRPSSGTTRRPEPWMLMVIASTVGFLFSLTLNLVAACEAAWIGMGPALAHGPDQRLVALQAWGFLVPAIWGFNARWLPVFLGLKAPQAGFLFAALALAWLSILSGFLRSPQISAAILPVAAICAILALHVWEKPAQPPKIQGVHPTFPVFIRISYMWLLVATILWVWAAWADRSGGIWGAARHALTVGFISTMVFCIGQRVLPAFGGGRVLYSPTLMFASLLALTVGCALRVSSEIPAYEGYWQGAWRILPVSAVVELTAVSLFAANLLLTFTQPPAHLRAPTALEASPPRI
ncbi:MAG: NnrS family protein [Acidobacteriota bacterium]